MGNQIEGALEKNVNCIVIEDLVSTGGSSFQAIEALQKAGAKVIGIVSVFTYGFPTSEKLFSDAQIPFYSLTDFSTLIEVIQQKDNTFPEQVIDALTSWITSPSTWRTEL